jgi:hypothetical protein
MVMHKRLTAFRGNTIHQGHYYSFYNIDILLLDDFQPLAEVAGDLDVAFVAVIA